MDILKVLVVVTALVYTVEAASPRRNCTDPLHFKNSIIGCSRAVGITARDGLKYLPTENIVVTAQDFHKWCANQGQYVRLGECVGNEMRKCKMNIMPEPRNAARILKALCDDSKMNIPCMLSASQHVSDITACVNSTLKFSQFKGKPDITFQDILCKTLDVAYKCGVNHLKNCDDYTATVHEGMQALAMPDACRAD